MRHLTLTTCKTLTLLPMLLALCACGHSSSSSRPSAPAPITDAAVKQVLDDVAASTPMVGSIVQSSNAGTAADTVDISLSEGNFRFTKGGRIPFVLTQGDSDNLEFEGTAVPGTITMAKVLRASGNSARIGAVYMEEDFDEDSHDSLAADTDHTVMGLWMVVDVDTSTSGGDITGLPEMGLFVDGNDYTGDLPTTDMSATYSGRASGMHWRSGTSLFDQIARDADSAGDGSGTFTAAASMTVSFLASGSHTARGTLSSIMTGNTEIDTATSDLVINLNTANWDSSANAFLDGDLGCSLGTSTCTLDGDNTSWGARFFGDANDDDVPQTMAGTFGATDVSISVGGQSIGVGTIIGVFRTSRDDESP